jgi:hypothetical protein
VGDEAIKLMIAKDKSANVDKKALRERTKLIAYNEEFKARPSF